MPLLGKFIFLDYANKSTKDVPFKIDCTGETFSSSEERDQKLFFYSQKLWSCQSTTQFNLTYKQAQDSEKKFQEIVKKRCMPSWEKPMLQEIHQSSDGLKNLVARIQKLFQTQYFVGEQVACEPSSSKKFYGEVVGVLCEVNVEGQSSPSSDKENNKSKQKLITDMFQKIQSPEKSKTELPKAQLPTNSSEVFKYNIQLAKENKMIKGVPSKVLTRVNKPPSRETIKLFIRTNALQISSGSVSGKFWIVNEKLVKKHSLPSKINDEIMKNLLKASIAKNVDYNKYKQLNGNAVVEISQSDFKTKKNTKSPMKKSTKSPQKAAKPLQKSSNVTITNGGYISDDDDVPLSSLFNVSKKKQQSLLSNAKVNGSMRKSTTPKKKKQATLLELTRKKGGMKVMTSVKSSPLSGATKTTPRKQYYRQPPLVYQLLSLKKEKKFREKLYKSYETKAAKILSPAQIERIPESIKAPIVAKRKVIDSRERWSKMTDEEKKEERARRRREHQQEMQQDIFEDQHLVAEGKSKLLPTYELLTLDNGIPNTAFGDVAMVVQFVNTYKDCISSPRDNLSLTCEQLITAITSGPHGDGLLSKIFMLIFQTLLGDKIANEYTEMEYRINKVEVNTAICSELTRICFRKFDDNDDVNDDENDDDLSAIPTELDENVYLRLLENEITELEPLDQLAILVALVNRILGTHGVDKRLDEASDQRKKALQNYQKEKLNKEEDKDDENVQVPDELNTMINDLTTADVDLVTRVKNRKLITEKERELREIERKRDEKQHQRLLREQEIEKSKKQYMSQCRARERLIRTKPLGVDRNHSRYWYFSDNIPGLYIEKGWSPFGDYTLDSTDSPKNEKLSPVGQETSVPPVGQNLWFVLRSKEDFDALLDTLCSNGIRESKLKKALQNNYHNITRSIVKFQSSSLSKKEDGGEEEDVEHKVNLRKRGFDAIEDMRNTLVKSLKEFARETSQGGLSNLDYAVMEVRINTAENIAGFRQILLDFLNSVRKECITFLDAPEDASKAVMHSAERRRQRWVAAVENANFTSRLLLLYYILNDSIRWDMYYYQRTRKSSRKNYADINDGKDSAEEEEEQKKVRSRRLKNRNKIKEEESSEEDEEQGISRSQRLRNRNKHKDPSSSEDDEEPSYGRSIRSRSSKRKKLESEDEEATGSRYGLRKRARVEVDDSDNEEDVRTSRRYEIEESDQEEDEDEEEEGSSVEEESDEENVSEQDVPVSEDEEIEICQEMLKKMKGYKCSCPFKYPVDPAEVVDYYDIVKNPICLEDIEKKMKEDEYSANEFVDDMKLLIDNADAYNEADNFIMRQCGRLANIFIRIFTEKFGGSKAHMEYFSQHFQT